MGSGKLRGSWGGASHIGGREEQQDRWQVTDFGDAGMLVTVADGMGGHQDGALAAQVVVDTLRRVARQRLHTLQTQPQQMLHTLCEEAASSLAEQSSMAHSTVVALWLYQGSAWWVHIGDSRCYCLRQGKRLMRTRDHSAVQMLVDLGEISESQMATHPEQNRLYRSLGGKQRPRPEVGTMALQQDDLLVLCSDGVWEYISEAEFWSEAQRSGPDRAAQELVKRAVKRGGVAADNATLVLVHIQELPWLRRLLRWLIPVSGGS